MEDRKKKHILRLTHRLFVLRCERCALEYVAKGTQNECKIEWRHISSRKWVKITACQDFLHCLCGKFGE